MKRVLWLIAFFVLVLGITNGYAGENEKWVAKGNQFSKGERVRIEWRGKWYPGQVLQVLGPNRYRIHYDGYDHSWDEMVSDRRLKSK